MKINNLNLTNLYSQDKNIRNFQNEPNEVYDTKSALYSSLNILSNYNIPFMRKGKPVYLIDESGELKRFNSQTQAANFLNINVVSIIQAIKREGKACGKIVINAQDIETVDDSGNTIIDKEKLDKIMKRFDKKYPENTISVYAVSKDCSIQKFNSQSDMALALGLTSSYISKCLSGTRNNAKGLFFVSAKDIETKNKDGIYSLDENKLSKIMEEKGIKAIRTNPENYKAVYAISPVDGTYKRFETQTQAAQELKVTRQCINNAVLSEKLFSKVSGFIIINASDIEYINEKGEICIDEVKFNQLLNRYLKNY